MRLSTTAMFALVALSTFALTRLLDRLLLEPVQVMAPSRSELDAAAHALRHVQQQQVDVGSVAGPDLTSLRVLQDKVHELEAQNAQLQRARLEVAVPAAQQPPPTAAQGPQPAAAAVSATATAAGGAKEPFLVVIGFPIGVDKRNYDRRLLLRELWYPEYPNIGKTVAVEFIVGLLTYQGDGHGAKVLDQLHDEHDRYGDMALVNAREATRDPYRGDPKCTGEKIVAWFQRVVVAHRGTPFFVKADWDTWIHTTRLEANLRILAQRNEPTYFGNTLWCSYSVQDFQPCGYGFGPLQAAGARHAECPQLPHGKDAVGPFPYAAGLFWGVSYDLVRWMAGSRLVYDFVHNASARFEPPYWVKGEDSAFGFFIHISPFDTVTPLHWGWNVVHDGWEFRSVAERGLCTQHTSNTSLVVHSMHTTEDWHLVRREFRELCDARCEQAELPFDVRGLADLCSRNPRIRNVYSKCANVGMPPTGATDLRRFERRPLPRPRCRSQGANVPFIAAKAQGGTISCDEERDKDWTMAEADRLAASDRLASSG